MPLSAHGALHLALVADERRARPQVGREREVHEGVRSALPRDVDEPELSLPVDLVEGEAPILRAHRGRGRDDGVHVRQAATSERAVAQIADGDVDAECAERGLARGAGAHEGAHVAAALAEAAADLGAEQTGGADDEDHDYARGLRSTRGCLARAESTSPTPLSTSAPATTSRELTASPSTATAPSAAITGTLSCATAACVTVSDGQRAIPDGVAEPRRHRARHEREGDAARTRRRRRRAWRSRTRRARSRAARSRGSCARWRRAGRTCRGRRACTPPTRRRRSAMSSDAERIGARDGGDGEQREPRRGEDEAEPHHRARTLAARDAVADHRELHDAEEHERADGGADAEIGEGEGRGVREERERSGGAGALHRGPRLASARRRARRASPHPAPSRIAVNPAASIWCVPSASRVSSEFDAKATRASRVSATVFASVISRRGSSGAAAR